VVVLGDILDRGNQVTETIWLLYRLEQEAMQQGGKLHIILGNHELMIFKGDTRYIADKYSILTKNFSLPYQKLFSKKTLIGQWLRSKNTALKINDNLFIHGGLHPDFIKVKLSLDSINNLVYNYLNSKKKEIHPLAVYDLIFGEKGPFWFRGLITNKVIQEKDVDALLKFYGVNHIFVGHTGLPKITTFYNGKVWGMDVPYYLYNGYPMEAIMIDANNIYLLNTSGMKTKIQTK
jgi:calcineurin-like phosphoesterase family protein